MTLLSMSLVLVILTRRRVSAWVVPPPVNGPAAAAAAAAEWACGLCPLPLLLVLSWAGAKTARYWGKRKEGREVPNNTF